MTVVVQNDDPNPIAIFEQNDPSSKTEYTEIARVDAFANVSFHSLSNTELFVVDASASNVSPADSKVIDQFSLGPQKQQRYHNGQFARDTGWNNTIPVPLDILFANAGPLVWNALVRGCEGMEEVAVPGYALEQVWDAVRDMRPIVLRGFLQAVESNRHIFSRESLMHGLEKLTLKPSSIPYEDMLFVRDVPEVPLRKYVEKLDLRRGRETHDLKYGFVRDINRLTVQYGGGLPKLFKPNKNSKPLVRMHRQLRSL